MWRWCKADDFQGLPRRKGYGLGKGRSVLGYICKEAEWKKSARAWDRYVDEDKVDPAKILDAMFELSEDEEKE